ncbi:panthothenate synthetase [Geobacter sp. SVR]|uniref:panthothenate synthetase n=1 Tax=Geobacter sp. SVR TaxID=2495594 RepID=UPI00143F0247|nr:panthothenate synthetase [Geobacter sp. SVR]BCS56019.1 hypothetical protein GSVR_43270 [Geobacter sp. SVR]GCF84782.1 hypothetical protein GSbR_13820 [Geobacter sp. SVR]
MRMLMTVELPTAHFNVAVKDGTAGRKLERILEQLRPEAVYFTEQDGRRSAIMIVNLENPAQIPALAEPWFLTFNAEVRFSIAMTPDELRRSELDALGREWS